MAEQSLQRRMDTSPHHPHQPMANPPSHRRSGPYEDIRQAMFLLESAGRRMKRGKPEHAADEALKLIAAAAAYLGQALELPRGLEGVPGHGAE
jgi:hypothetical protein